MRSATLTLALLGLLFAGTATVLADEQVVIQPATPYVTAAADQSVVLPARWYGYGRGPGWYGYYGAAPYYTYRPYGYVAPYTTYAPVVPYTGYAPYYYPYGYRYVGPRRYYYGY